MTPDEQTVKAIVEKIADEGRIIRDGWEAFYIQTIPGDTPISEVAAMRYAYLAGAQHLWGAINAFIDLTNKEAAELSMRRLQLVEAELQGVAQELALRYAEPQGQS